MTTSCPHTNFRKGQRIVVILKSGGRFIDKFIDKFIEKKSTYIITENNGRTPIKNIRQAVIKR